MIKREFVLDRSSAEKVPIFDDISAALQLTLVYIN